jgi:S1-C subfamily serine protease
MGLYFKWMKSNLFGLLVMVLGISAVALTSLLFAQQPSVPAPTGGGVASAEPAIHLVRSICGSKGSQTGDHFVMEDPRSVFYLPEDKQVMVYFEWEGATGQHHFEGFWKNPEGKVVVLSDFTYEAKQKRFAGYWALPLTDSMSPGIWVMEAHVDGELAGSYNFQIAVAPRPPLPTPRPNLTPADLYKRLLPGTVWVERMDAQRHRISVGSGFVAEGNLIVTTFENIESASSVRVTSANGVSVDLNGLAAWNRSEDWAVMRSPEPFSGALPLAKPGSWQIGDTCYSLDSPQEGSRTIVSGNITGNHKFPDVGERWNLNFQLSTRAGGAPVVTEYGEVIGIASTASLVPGLSSLALAKAGEFPEYPINLAGQDLTPSFGAVLVLPMSMITLPQSENTTTTFVDMAKSGQFLPNLVRNEDLMVGSLGKSIDRQHQSMTIKDSRFEYQRRDGQLSVLVTWNPQGKLKSSALLKIYNIDNRLVGTSESVKINLSKGQLGFTAWTLTISQLTPGFYRVDMLLSDIPVWRTFFRITE